ncbi:hypothetical protein D3C72_1087240 [compost metagenome]
MFSSLSPKVQAPPMDEVKVSVFSARVRTRRLASASAKSPLVGVVLEKMVSSSSSSTEKLSRVSASSYFE